MPIILVNNPGINVTQSVDQPEKKADLKPVIKQPVQETSDHHVLVVNGKHKKVSKHSAYMLDMLTIDEE